MPALPAEQTVTRSVTIEEIMQIASGHPDTLFEVVNGEIVEKMGAGGLHHFTLKIILNILDDFVRANNLGIVVPDGLLYLLNKRGRGIKGARIADISFIRREKFPKNWNMEEPFPGAPDLAIEIMSPTDTTEETLQRVRDYLAAGTEQVWVFFPRQKEVHQHRRDVPETVRVYYEHERMDVAALFPGLETTVADFFKLPDWMTAPDENPQEGTDAS